MEWKGEGNFIDNVIDDGYVIQNWQNMMRRKAEPYTIEFEDKSFLVLNARGNSKNFDFVDKGKTDGLMLWTFNGTEYTYTMYHSKKGKKDNIDLSEIAVQYGGGGHPGACGFASKKFLAK